jgi:hypothetical protein
MTNLLLILSVMNQESSKKTLLDVLLSVYEKTKFPYIGVNGLITSGAWDKCEAISLHSKGIIKVKIGMHCKIIELIPDKAYQEIKDRNEINTQKGNGQ